MTIRQIGGVFGRNPSFQDVTTQDFTATGNVDLSGASPIAIGAVTGLFNVFLESSASNIFEIERTGSGAGKTGMRQDGGLFTVDTNNDGVRWMRAGGEMARLRFGNLSVGTTDITNRLNIGGNIGLTGNVIVANGKGIDFSATSGTGTSELFDDYEEGAFEITMTPSTSGTITLDTPNNECSYTKIGRQVFVTGMVIVSAVASPVGASIAIPLPFSTANLGDAAGRFTGICTQNSSGTYVLTPMYAAEGVSTADLLLDASTVSGTKRFYFSFTYITA